MKKPIIYTIVFLLILVYLIFNKIETQNKVEDYFKINEQINKLILLNNSFDIFLINNTKQNSFDNIKNNIEQIDNIIQTIDKHLLIYNDKKELIALFGKIKKDLKLKIEMIKKIKPYENSLDFFKIKDRLEKFSFIYNEISKENLNEAYFLVVIIFILLFLSACLFLYNSYVLYKNNLSLKRFSNAIDNSDNMVVITDKEQKIKYVNQAFIDTTGYSKEEIYGKTPSILQSSQHPKEFYQQLNETIYSGKKWIGTFINITKSGKKQFEKASIVPIFDENGDILEFIALKLDITSEINALNKLREQEKIIFEQSKMASMGEMLNNIAHQWRQPLSLISTSVTGLQVQKEAQILSDDKLMVTLDIINNTVQKLSNTIDSFRDFFEIKNEKTYFNLLELIKKTMSLVEIGLKTDKIKLINKVDNVQLYGYYNELIQVLINIINNAKDALIKNDIEKKLIIIQSFEYEDKIKISIKDNAKGIDEKIIKKIFEPYFTTKHQSQGTGLGLYNVYEMVTKHMHGSIDVKNVSFNYEGVDYTGAEFIITIAKNIENKNV